jgi:hypothetical protein
VLRVWEDQEEEGLKRKESSQIVPQVYEATRTKQTKPSCYNIGNIGNMVSCCAADMLRALWLVV